MDTDTEDRTFLRTRRGVLRAGASLGGFLLLEACMPATPASSLSPAAQVQRGGPILLGVEDSHKSLDPHIDPDPSTAAFGQLYDTLIISQLADPTTGRFELIGGLAETWNVESEKNWVFKLRKGIRFHDGSDWNADAAAWNLLRMRDNPRSAAKSLVSDIVSIDKPDAYTIKVNLSGPAAAFPSRMTVAGSNGYARMVSRVAVDKLGDDAFGQQPVGSGPFSFGQWVRDSKVVLKRFDGYWRNGSDGKALPYLDGMELAVMSDATLALQRLRSGDSHVIYPSSKDVGTVKSDSKLQYLPLPWTGLIDALALNGQSGKFASSVPLRKAFGYAIPYDGIAQARGFGQAIRARYFWPKDGIGYDESIPYYATDTQQAKQLLRDAGFENGVDLDMLVINDPDYIRTAEAIQAGLQPIGFRLKLKVLEVTQWRDKAKSGVGWDLTHLQRQWLPDPDAQSRQLLTAGAGNWVRSSNTRIDQLMSQGGREFDPKRRHEIYKQVQQLVYEDALWHFIYAVPTGIAASVKLKGLTTQWDMWQWDGAQLAWT